MILARFGTWGAILCCLWFNGSYAATLGATETEKIALIALALTIDLCKCGFLPAASTLWIDGARLRPLVLALLWLPMFAFSTLCGYAAISLKRGSAGIDVLANEQARTRAQADYDNASAALSVAKASPLWTTTAACTAPKDNRQRQFCTGIDDLVASRETAAQALAATPPVTANAELKPIAALTGTTPESIAFVIAIAAAVLIELAASLGFYALSSKHVPDAPERAQNGRRPRRLGWWRRSRKTQPDASAVAQDDKQKSTPPAAVVWNLT